jgi:hypothetical protein
MSRMKIMIMIKIQNQFQGPPPSGMRSGGRGSPGVP